MDKAEIPRIGKTAAHLVAVLQEVEADSPERTVVHRRAFAPIARDQRQSVSAHSLSVPSMHVTILRNLGIEPRRLIRHLKLGE